MLFIDSIFILTLTDHPPSPLHTSLKAISRCTVETMAVTTSSAGGVVLALGTTAGEVFVVAVSVVESLLWDSLDTGTGTSTATVKRCR